MYATSKRIAGLGSAGLAALVFAGAAIFLTADLHRTGTVIISGALFVALYLAHARLLALLEAFLRRRVFVQGPTRILGELVDRLRFCFTTGDLVSAFRDIVEYRADGTILFFDMAKRYMVYASPTIIGTDPALPAAIVRHYDGWRNGVFFFDENLDLISAHARARGFLVVQGTLQVYCFMRYAGTMDAEIFPQLHGEFASFLKRNETIEKMFAIAAVSREWSLVAETQRGFLPKTLPAIPRLDLAAHFKPLVNVSGDYYDVLPLDGDRTLLLLGDVSGKGLAAALIMGIVVNTIRIIERKDNLEQLVLSVDQAIKGMRLEDKYTVLFAAVVDTRAMTLRFINASMADPLIISETRAGRQIRRLSSNCRLIGILDLERVQAQEVKIFPGDTILIASDGVSDVQNQSGEMLGESERWLDFITEESSRPVGEFVEALAALTEEYAGLAPLRDDVTILAAKVRG